MRVYVASSWRCFWQPLAVRKLKDAGCEVYDFRHPEPGNVGFSWREIHPDWENWTPEQYIEALGHPIAEQGFKLDADALAAADVTVLVLPCGRSAHVEAAWAKGRGQRVYVWMPEQMEPELMYKLFDGIYPHPEGIEALVGAVVGAAAREAAL